MPDIPGINRPFPGYAYVGPGNYGYHVPPVNELDALARDHDLAYERSSGWGPLIVMTDLSVAQADAVLALRAAEIAVTGGENAGAGERIFSLLTSGLFGAVAAGKYAWIGVIPSLGNIIQRLPERQQDTFVFSLIILGLRQLNMSPLEEINVIMNGDYAEFIKNGNPMPRMWQVTDLSGNGYIGIATEAQREEAIERGIVRSAVLYDQDVTEAQWRDWTQSWGDLIVPLNWNTVTGSEYRVGATTPANLISDMFVRRQNAIATATAFVQIRNPSPAQILANQAAYDFLNSIHERGDDVALAFPRSYGFTVSKVSKSAWNVNVDGIFAAQFSTMARAQNVAKKGNALLRRIVVSSVSVDSPGFSNGIGQWVTDGAIPNNGFNPPLTLSS